MQVLKMFHRKVHPEQSIFEKESVKSHKEKIMRPLHYDGYYADPMHQDNNNIKFPLGSKPVEGVHCCPSNMKMREYGLCGNHSSNNKEYWIKTDSECKFWILINALSLHFSLTSIFILKKD